MKGLFLVAAFTLLCAGVASGQMADIRSHQDHHAGRMEYGIAGGLNIASNECALRTGTDTDGDFAYGFVGSLFVDHSVTERLAMRIGVGVVMGGSDAVMPIDGVSTKFETRTTHLDVPVLAKLGIADFGHHSIYAVAGSNFGYLLSAKTNDEDISDTVKSYDLGLIGGAGISMPVGNHRVFLEAKYNFGVLDTSDTEGESLKNRGIRITTGFYF